MVGMGWLGGEMCSLLAKQIEEGGFGFHSLDIRILYVGHPALSILESTQEDGGEQDEGGQNDIDRVAFLGRVFGAGGFRSNARGSARRRKCAKRLGLAELGGSLR